MTKILAFAGSSRIDSFNRKLVKIAALGSESAEAKVTLAAFHGKVAAIMSASPGGLGGLRGLVFLRMLLSNIGVMVLPGQQTVPHASKAFGSDGSLIDAKKQKLVLNVGIKLVETVKKLKG